MGENWAAFSPSCKGKMPPNLQEKNGQHFALLLYQIPPQKLQPIEPELRNLLASHSAVPKPLRQFNSAVLLAPPSDPFGIYEVWGSTASLSAPPLDPFGITGYGALGGGCKSTLDLSSRNVRFAQRKSKTGFLGPTQNNVALA